MCQCSHLNRCSLVFCRKYHRTMGSIEINRNIGTQLLKHTPENVLHVSVTITEIGTFKLRLKSSFWFQTIHDFYTLNSGYLIYLFLVIISNVQSLKTCLDYLLQINCCWIWNYLATLLLPGVNLFILRCCVIVFQAIYQDVCFF